MKAFMLLMIVIGVVKSQESQSLVEYYDTIVFGEPKTTLNLTSFIYNKNVIFVFNNYSSRKMNPSQASSVKYLILQILKLIVIKKRILLKYG